MKFINLLVLACATLTFGSQISAQPSYPDRPIKLVVPFPAGGDSDILGRLIANGLSQGLKQTVTVENRAGATGMIGVDAVAKSKPDGYTILLTLTATQAMLPHMHSKMAYDALKDFAPIGQAVRSGIILVANPDLPVKSVQELISLAKSKPNGVSYASWGNGSGGHLVGEAIKLTSGANLLHVPYKGVAPALNDVMAGHIPVMFTGFGTAIPLINTGKLRALAVIGKQRSPVLPDVPTLIEQGIDFDGEAWFGLFAPAGTSPEIIKRLNTELNKTLELPEVNQRLKSLGFVPQSSTPEQFAATVLTFWEKWGKIIGALGIKLD
jgi:tripartite-type tricarboxylate transporter receptor subunit TctC